MWLIFLKQLQWPKTVKNRHTNLTQWFCHKQKQQHTSRFCSLLWSSRRIELNGTVQNWNAFLRVADEFVDFSTVRAVWQQLTLLERYQNSASLYRRFTHKRHIILFTCHRTRTLHTYYTGIFTTVQRHTINTVTNRWKTELIREYVWRVHSTESWLKTGVKYLIIRYVALWRSLNKKCRCLFVTPSTSCASSFLRNLTVRSLQHWLGWFNQ